MYKPTKKELDDMGFCYERDDYFDRLDFWHVEHKISGSLGDNGNIEWLIDQDGDLAFYPQSRQDVEKLIELFTYRP